MENNDALQTEVFGFIEKILRKKIDPSNLDASLTDDYDATSMDIVDIVETMETKYGLVINNQQMLKFQTINDILKFIEAGVGNLQE